MTCEWERRLAVKCYEHPSTGKTMIRVYTNSMPNHCMQSSNKFPDENHIHFEVEFNIPPARLTKNNQSSQTSADISLCSNTWLADGQLTRKHAFTRFSGNMVGIVGVATNGVPIHFGTSELSYDAFFPKSYGKYIRPTKTDVDVCLGSPNFGNYYKYYGYSPCIFESAAKNIRKATMCQDNNSCWNDLTNYIVAQVPTDMKTMKTIGIAKDGHLIQGPYKDNGRLW